MFPGGNAPYSVRSHGHEARQGPVESNKSRGPRKRPYIISSTACLTREQEMYVDKRARSLQSDVPIYASVMNKSSVGDNSLYAVVSRSRSILYTFQLPMGCVIIHCVLKPGKISANLLF